MTHRLTEAELAELERTADIYPYIGVMEHVARLRWAYARIDLQAELAGALRCVVEMEHDRDPESRNFDEERLDYFAGLVERAGRVA